MPDSPITTEDQIRVLMSIIVAYDNRNVEDVDVMAWLKAAEIGRWTFAAARDAIHRHFATSTEWLKPGHVTQALRAERRQPSSHAAQLPPPCGQCDARPGEPGSARVTVQEDGSVTKCPRCHPSHGGAHPPPRQVGSTRPAADPGHVQRLMSEVADRLHWNKHPEHVGSPEPLEQPWSPPPRKGAAQPFLKKRELNHLERKYDSSSRQASIDTSAPLSRCPHCGGSYHPDAIDSHVIVFGHSPLEDLDAN